MRFAIFAIIIALLPWPTLLQADGMSAHGDYFPIAVWLQSPRNAEKYKAIGINLYVGLWDGPKADDLMALQQAGMKVVCDQNAEALLPKWNDLVVGWLQNDEPDNAQSLGKGKGYGPPVLPGKIVERYKQLKSRDSLGRPVMLNLGQGVAWDGWYGRGVRTNKPEDYPQYVAGGDVVSFDIYPAVHDHKDVAGKLWYVGKGVARLNKWVDGKKPVWTCIETTHIGNKSIKPTPEQVRAEVWMAIIHGARGIVYFCHEFAPKFVEAGLLGDAEMAQSVGKINEEIRSYAKIINDGENVNSAKVEGGDVAILARRSGNSVYIFAVGMSDSRMSATIDLPENKPTSTIEVLGEQRKIQTINGKLTDEFRGYQIHLYRVPVAAK